MSFRRDKLILLLDTGTSPPVRRTAAKQLSDLTLKTFRSTASPPTPSSTHDAQSSDVKPLVEEGTDKVTLAGQGSTDDAWQDVLDTISKLLPLLKSKSSDTRHAASNALGLLAAALPPWIPTSSAIPIPPPSFPPVDLPTLLRSGRTLLASAGREYVAKPTGRDRAKAAQAMKAKLGISDGLGGWGDDVDKLIVDEDEEPAVDMDANGKKSSRPATPSASAALPPALSQPPKDIFEGLSARQITMLKRKKGNMIEEANKLRKLNQASAAPSSSPSTAQPTPAPSPPPDEKPGVPATPSSERVTIDPGAKARAQAAAGGAVEPQMDADGNPISALEGKARLSYTSTTSPWVLILEEVAPNLSDAGWQMRHGAALAVMEVVRSVGGQLGPGSEAYLIALARQLIELLALDRFGDFVGDTVIAPVRETAAQALGVLLKSLNLAGLKEVHECLMGMVSQTWAKRGKEAEGLQKGERFSWEVRHAGLLGLKYEVAVRSDLLGRPIKIESEVDGDIKPTIDEDGAEAGLDIMGDVVDAAILALRDADDDVRTVAASALLPISAQLTSGLPHGELERVVDTLWDCLAEGGDELGSSTGSVMDLLGAMISHEQVIGIMAEDARSSGPRSRQALISRIYAFIRHPITSVRLAVAQALHTFSTVPSLPRADWMDEAFFSLLFQNLVLEERDDIRKLSFAAFEAGLEEINNSSKGVDAIIGPRIRRWYEMVMTPPGVALDESLFIRPEKARKGGHNVDKGMMAGDLGLVPMESVLETRIAAGKALALVRRYQSGRTLDLELLGSCLSGPSAHQLFMAATILQEHALDVDQRSPDACTISLGSSSDAIQPLATMLVRSIESPPKSTYHEMSVILRRIQTECHALLTAFSVEGKLSKERIPSLPTSVDPLSDTPSSVFTLETAQLAIGQHFDALAGMLSKSATKNALPSLKDRRRKVMASIGYFSVMKERYDTMVAAGVASALVALRVMPAKLGPVIKSLMDSVKKEELAILQSRSAQSVAAFVEYCNSPLFTGKVNPCDKVVKNLFTFLCSDTSVCPVFASQSTLEGILSLKEDRPKEGKKGEVVDESEEEIAMRVTRRGALEAFTAMAGRFGARLFESVPRYWEGISGPLRMAFPDGVNIDDADTKLRESPQLGQDLVDCLTSLRLVLPQLDAALHPSIMTLFGPIIACLQSSFAVVRSCAAKCVAVMCDVMTDEGMRRVVDEVVPLIGDAKREASRQGAVEAIHHIIKLLDIKALPYVLFLIVPILGRMSDPSEPVRLLSTQTFASLVKMVPLEAGIPDPPGFSADMLSKRDEERKFLMQLLDGSKAEMYEIPIEVKAELRAYQREGVSWLAFLAKYQLHGILCDDMGLGKSLQSICIIGSKHHERAAKHARTGSVDTAHLPSLIVCPPTLIGHWYYEILKFTSSIRPLQYTGSAAQRAAIRQEIPKHDVVIASYESVRADIAELGKIDWLYCVLDEGHIIKNAKTKLAAAVKQLRAQHRLLLSGTPIQNNVLELWSLFDFLMPGFLGSERAFNDRFSKPVLADREGKATPKERELAATALESLHKQVLPFLLRRLKEDVLHDLPPKIIQDYYCDLSDVQKTLYDEFAHSRAAEEAGEEIVKEEGGGDAAPPQQQHVFQSLQYLRKLCNHPALVLDGDPARWTEVKRRIAKDGDVGKVPDLRDISHAPKLEALRQLLTDCGIGLPPAEKLAQEASDSQHRVLIFCQLRPMLDLIEQTLFARYMPSVSYMRMDGSTDPKKRHAIVQTFNDDPQIDVLLLTTSVGGLGLNLTGADTVIFVDHDWNPMKDLQAMDRAHRLGQRKVVNVYRLITRGTLEEKIMGLQRFKLNIASSVVTQQNAGLGSMNTGEVLDLFTVSADAEPGKPAKQSTGPVSASKVLEGLEDLPPEDEYAELSLENFMSKV